MILWRRTDDLVLGLIKETGLQALNGRMMDRRQRAARKWSVWINEFHDLVDEQLRAIFCDENYQNMRLETHACTNVLRRVTEDVCLLYQEAPTRYLKGVSAPAREAADGQVFDLIAQADIELAQADVSEPTGGAVANASGGNGAAAQGAPSAATAGVEAAPPLPEEAQQTPFERWMEHVDLDTLWAEVEKISYFNDVVWIFPVVRLDEDGVAHLHNDIYTAANADIVPDPEVKGRAIGWYTWREEPVTKEGAAIVDAATLLATAGSRVMKRFYYLYTPKTIQKLNEQFKPVGKPIENPVKRLPVVAVRSGRVTDSYYLDGQGDDLYDATLDVCTKKTLENKAFWYSSFKQPVIDAEEKDAPTAQVMGNPGFPIRVGQDSTASTLDFSADLDRLGRTIKDREISIANTHGVSAAAWSMSEKVQSGFSKKMDSVKILSRNRKKRTFFAAAEKDLYRLTALRLKAEPVEAIGALDPSATLVVDFAEPRFEEAPVEQTKADAENMKLGKISIVDVFLRDNPDMSEAEALRELARNKVLNDRFLQVQGELTIQELIGRTKMGGGGGFGADQGAGTGGGP